MEILVLKECVSCSNSLLVVKISSNKTFMEKAEL